jgi:hypothetical protein
VDRRAGNAEGETVSAIPKSPNPRGSAHSPMQIREGGWAEYSRLKNEFIKKHPNASSREIDQAARRIAKQLNL